MNQTLIINSVNQISKQITETIIRTEELLKLLKERSLMERDALWHDDTYNSLMKMDAWWMMNVVNKHANWKQSDQLLMSEVDWNRFFIWRHELQNHKDETWMINKLCISSVSFIFVILWCQYLIWNSFLHLRTNLNLLLWRRVEYLIYSQIPESKSLFTFIKSLDVCTNKDWQK